MTQGVIKVAQKSKSGKNLQVCIDDNWYSTKNWELQGMVGKAITFEPSPQQFPDGGSINWINEYNEVGASNTPSAQAFDQRHQQNAGQTAPPSQTDKDLTITALALVKCIEGIKTPQQAYEHFNEVKRLLSGKANPQTPEGYMDGHDQEIPF